MTNFSIHPRIFARITFNDNKRYKHVAIVVSISHVSIQIILEIFPNINNV